MDFTPTAGGWDLTMELEAPDDASRLLQQAQQAISVDEGKRTQAGPGDNLSELVRMLGRDPFSRQGSRP